MQVSSSEIPSITLAFIDWRRQNADMSRILSSPRIAIIGAGIIGAALAYALAKRGVSVTVLDEGVPGNRATRGSFGWINAHRPEDAEYFALRLDSMRLWQGLIEEIDGLPVRLGGALNWEGAERIETVAKALDEGGNTARLVSRARIREMEPALATPPEVAIDAPLEGVADPDRIAEALLIAAAALGAEVRTGVRVTGIAEMNDRVRGVETAAGPVDAECVVVAAGKATSGILAGVGVPLPMKAPLGLLVRTAPVPRLSQRIFTSDELHVWQMDDGRLILGEDFGGSPVASDAERAETERRVLERARAAFGGVTLALDGSTVTARPIPEDGYPAVGRVPGMDGLFVATMHSGVTLAPVMARELSMMILDDAEAGMLARYGMERFGAG